MNADPLVTTKQANNFVRKYIESLHILTNWRGETACLHCMKDRRCEFCLGTGTEVVPWTELK